MNGTRRITKNIIDISAAFIFIYLLIRPSVAENSAKVSVMFCIDTIIPSLFVFMVLSKLFMGRVFSLSGKMLPYACLLGGIICGFPVGTMNIRELYKEGKITKNQAEVLVSCSNNASASFIISFVGAAVLKSVKAGFVLLAGKTVISVLWYVFLSSAVLNKDERKYSSMIKTEDVSLTDAVHDSAVSIMAICACIVFFMCIGDVICSRLSGNNLLQCFIHGLFEFSGGISLCSGLKPTTAYIVCGMLLGWSGMCVHLQVSMSAGNTISLKYYWLNRLFESFAMGMFAVLTKPLLF